MLLLDTVRRSSRSLLSAKTRTLLTSFAIAVGAFALSLTLAASNGAQKYADQIVSSNFDPSELIVFKNKNMLSEQSSSQPREYNQNYSNITLRSGASSQIEELSKADIDTVKSISGVASVRTNTSVNLKYITRDGQRKYIGTVQAFSSYGQPELLAGSIPKSLPLRSVILPEGFVSALGFSSAKDAIGKPIRFAVQKQSVQSSILSKLSQGQFNPSSLQSLQPESEEVVFKVIAVAKKPSALVQPGTALYLKADIASVNALDDYINEGTASYQKYLNVFAKVKNGTDPTELKLVQDRIEAKGYGTQSVIDTQQTITQVIGVLQGIVTVFGAIAVIASVFGVVNTMYISVLQRTREIGLMKALGMHRKDINKLFLFEAAFIGLIGGVIGSGLAVLVGVLLNPFISKQLGLGDTALLQFQPHQIVILVASLVLVAVLAGLLPARKAAKLDPIEALRTE